MPVERGPLGPPITWLASVLAEREPQATRRASAWGVLTAVAPLSREVQVRVWPERAQATQPSIRRLKQKGKIACLTALGYLPLCIPPGGSVAGPSNITRHYAKWPHARTSLVSAATSHNTALCVNGPEGRPQTPLGLTQGGERTRRSKAFKSIPTHLGSLGLAAPASAKSALSSVPAKPSPPTPGKSKSQPNVASFHAVLNLTAANKPHARCIKPSSQRAAKKA